MVFWKGEMGEDGGWEVPVEVWCRHSICLDGFRFSCGLDGEGETGDVEMQEDERGVCCLVIEGVFFWCEISQLVGLDSPAMNSNNRLMH